jgi:hypothetical protein
MAASLACVAVLAACGQQSDRQQVLNISNQLLKRPASLCQYGTAQYLRELRTQTGGCSNAFAQFPNTQISSVSIQATKATVMYNQTNPPPSAFGEIDFKKIAGTWQVDDVSTGIASPQEPPRGS